MKRKLLTLLLALVLVISIIPIYDIKADDWLDPVVSFEDMTSEEILNYILDSYRGIYNFDETGTFEDYLDYVVNKLPYFTKDNINYNLAWTDQYPTNIYTNSKITLNYVNRCSLTWGFYQKGMDGVYSKMDNVITPKRLTIQFSIPHDYKRAEDLYDTLAAFIEKYYPKCTNNKNVNNSYEWACTVSYRDLEGYGQYSYDTIKAVSMTNVDSDTISTTHYYLFTLDLVHPDNIKNATEFSKTFLETNTNTVAQPIINSITNKKSKKIVVKYTEENASKKGIYTIQYSTNKNFKNAKEIESKKTSTTISKLKKNKTYYVRVKYTIDGQSSDWSEVKTIKIKK